MATINESNSTQNTTQNVIQSDALEWVNHIPYIYKDSQWVKYSTTKVHTSGAWFKHNWKIYTKKYVSLTTAKLGAAVLGQMILGKD